MHTTPHTPGPWLASPSEREGAIDIINEQGYFIAVICGGIGPGIERANASLIGAAPELKRAVEMLCTIIKRSAPTLTGTMEYGAAQTALARAEVFNPGNVQ